MAEAVQNSEELKSFFVRNRKDFEEKLLSEAVNVRDKIDEILAIGNINLIKNAHNLIVYIIDGQEDELIAFAKQEGIAWATHSLELTFKLEWVQAIRRTLWIFIEKYDQAETNRTVSDFFHLEKQLNSRVDTFLNEFFISYSTYKDSLLKAHRQLVENLSVPIIPITPSVSILPLIGSVDAFRTSIMEEKVLMEVSASRIQTLIMDLSGIADMEPEVIYHLLKILNGTKMMGCKTVITGLRPDVVRKMIHMDLSFDQKAETLGTLQQALKEYLIV